MDGLIVDCSGDFGAFAGVHGSAAMCGEELFYNADVNTNVVGFITDYTGDLGPTAGVLDSAAMGGECNFCVVQWQLAREGDVTN